MYNKPSIDEDSKLRALISNNFGRRKNDPSKDRKALEIYVLYHLEGISMAKLEMVERRESKMDFLKSLLMKLHKNLMDT